MKLYTIDFGWRGGYAVIAGSKKQALRKMVAYFEKTKDHSVFSAEFSLDDLTLDNIKEHGDVYHFVGDS